MRRIGVHETRFKENGNDDVVTLFARAREYEYNLLEINGERLLSLSPLGLKRISLEARNFQLDLSYSLSLGPLYDLSSLDEEVRKRGLSTVEKIIRNIGQMGGGSLNGPFYTAFPPLLPVETQKDRLFEQSVGSLRSLANIAVDEDVLLNIRPVNRYEHFFLNTADDALQFVRAVNHPGCGIDLDTFHMNIEESDMLAAFEQAGYYLHCIHIRENNGQAVGNGALPWVLIKERLDLMHYEGPLVHAPEAMKIAPFEGKQIRKLLS